MDDRELLKVVMGIVGRDRCMDDCAEIPFGENILVATTDMLHRSTDFVPGMTDWQAGWMSAAVTLSDIAGMGAAPKYLLIAVGLDDWKSLEGVMKGARDCCAKYGAEIIGGDIDRHVELTVVTTGLGIVSRRDIARRTGAWPDDLVCITSQGNTLKLRLAEIATQGKTAMGVRIVNITKPDVVVGVARVVKEEESEQGPEG